MSPPIDYVQETPEEKAHRKWSAKGATGIVLATAMFLAWAAIWVAPLLNGWTDWVRAATLDITIEGEHTPAATYVMSGDGKTLTMSYPAWEFPGGMTLERAWASCTRSNADGTVTQRGPFNLSLKDPVDGVRTFDIPVLMLPDGAYDGQRRYAFDITYKVLNSTGETWKYAKVTPSPLRNIATSP